MSDLFPQILAGPYRGICELLLVVAFAGCCARAGGWRLADIVRTGWRCAEQSWHGLNIRQVWLGSLATRADRAAAWVAIVALALTSALFFSAAAIFGILAALSGPLEQLHELLFIVPALTSLSLAITFRRGALRLQREVCNAAH